MKKYRILRNIFIVITIILSHLMCTQVAFNYANMLCAIENKGFSAPASTAFVLAVPYGMGIMICLILISIFNKNYTKRRNDK